MSEHPPADRRSSDRLTVVIPVKWSLTKPDCALRLVANCLRLRRLGVRDVLIADGSAVGAPFRAIARAFGFRHLAVDCPQMYTPATVKNAALARLPVNHYALFLDVDVLLTERALEQVRAQLAADVQFAWLPVVFLDRRNATRTMVRHALGRGQPADVAQHVQIGYTTGIQLLHVGFAVRLGFYREDFLGYGCEDIEMIHRATAALGRRPLHAPASEYYRDVRAHDASQLAGFRRHYHEMLRDYALEAMPLHYWHKRHNQSEYMRQRARNDQLLLQRMQDHDAWRLQEAASTETFANSALVGSRLS